MDRSRTAIAGLLLLAAISVSLRAAGQAQDVPSVRRVQVLGNRTPIEIEIEATDQLVPQTQVLTGPDRLVVDFANTVPGAQLRNQTLNRGEVKSVRVGLFTSKPPVTRVVFDLDGPQAYQIFPVGRTVIIKVGTVGVQASAFKPASSGARLVNSNYPVQSLRITPPQTPPLIVTFQGGLLHVTANKANLSEVLFAIHQHTGAEIAIPAGAEQEQVVAEIGPAPAPEVLSHLLNGSKFNFLILSSANDPATLDRVILSARPEGPAPTYRPQVQSRSQDDVEAEVNRREIPPPAEAPAPAPPAGNQATPAPPETRTSVNNDIPD
jgi:hypothetical protein